MTNRNLPQKRTPRKKMSKTRRCQLQWREGWPCMPRAHRSHAVWTQGCWPPAQEKWKLLVSASGSERRLSSKFEAMGGTDCPDRRAYRRGSVIERKTKLFCFFWTCPWHSRWSRPAALCDLCALCYRREEACSFTTKSKTWRTLLSNLRWGHCYGSNDEPASHGQKSHECLSCRRCLTLWERNMKSSKQHYRLENSVRSNELSLRVRKLGPPPQRLQVLNRNLLQRLSTLARFLANAMKIWAVLCFSVYGMVAFSVLPPDATAPVSSCAINHSNPDLSLECNFLASATS